MSGWDRLLDALGLDPEVVNFGDDLVNNKAADCIAELGRTIAELTGERNGLKAMLENPQSPVTGEPTNAHTLLGWTILGKAAAGHNIQKEAKDWLAATTTDKEG